MSTIAFQTAYEDFTIKHENDINGIKWTFNVVNTYFANSIGVYLNIYVEQGEEPLLTRGKSSINGVSISNNEITWFDDWANVNLAPKQYYYSLFYEDSTLTHPTVKLSEGILTVA